MKQERCHNNCFLYSHLFCIEQEIVILYYGHFQKKACYDASLEWLDSVTSCIETDCFFFAPRFLVVYFEACGQEIYSSTGMADRVYTD